MISVRSLQRSEEDFSDLIKYIYLDLAMSICPFLRKHVSQFKGYCDATFPKVFFSIAGSIFVETSRIGQLNPVASKGMDDQKQF